MQQQAQHRCRPLRHPQAIRSLTASRQPRLHLLRDSRKTPPRLPPPLLFFFLHPPQPTKAITITALWFSRRISPTRTFHTACSRFIPTRLVEKALRVPSL